MAKIGESGENYLEVILQIGQERGEVRSIEIAKRMHVSRASVNKAVNILKESQLVLMEPYGEIILTELGRCRALAVKRRHELLKTFLIDVLSISETTANEDACRIEHVVSEEFIEKLDFYLKKDI